MKKIFTLVFSALIALTASAQIEITKDGKVIKEGETVEFFADEIVLSPDFAIIECAPHEPTIKNISNNDVQVNILVEKLSKEDQLTVCSFGACDIIMGMSGSKSGTIKAGKSENMEVHAGQFEKGQYKSYNAKVTVTCGSFKLSFFEKFTYADPTGIESTHADKVTVNNKQLSYSFANNATHSLNIYGVSGRLVKSTELAQNGTVALNDLHRGVYIYEILTDGKRTAAHKFVVR